MGDVSRYPASRTGPVSVTWCSASGPLNSAFAAGLIALLVGYMLLDRSFAYLHLPVGFPLYIGEIVLALGLLAMALSPRLPFGILRTLPGRLFLALFALGVVRTLPFWGTYGLNAVRDAAVYYYGFYMILAYELVRERSRLERVMRGYGYVAFVFVYWAPVAFFISQFAASLLPTVPGTDLSLFAIRTDSLAVHLAGAFAFVLMFDRQVLPAHSVGLRLAWYVSAALSVMLAKQRSAYLALACAFLTMAGLGRRGRLWRPLTVGLVAILIVLAIDPKLTLPSGREISSETVTGLVGSIFTRSEDPRFREGTKTWRLRWWSNIVDETVFGRYFWDGRGFGENLADAHGYQTGAGARPLRSPHNAHMTILARMGVPGFLIWILLQGSLVRLFYVRWRHARDVGDRLLQSSLAWVICFWVAAMVVSTFTVYLEGPQGAIPFWCAMGVGLAAARMEPVPKSDEGAES